MNPASAWVVAVLAASIAWKLLDFPSGWWKILAGMAGGLWPMGPHFAANLGTGLAGAASAAILGFACDAGGLRALRLVTRRPIDGALRLSSFFFGYALLSMALFGMALASLWFPSALWTVPVLFTLFAGPEIPAAWRDWRGWARRIWGSAPLAGKTALVASALWWYPLVAGPEINADCMQYHFAFPAQVLLAHKFIGRDIYLAWGYPLLVEMPNVFALLSHLDGLAHALRPFMALLGCAAFLRGTGLWPGPALGFGTAWLALLAPSFAYVLGYSKNDAFAAGALLALAGLLFGGGLFRREPLRGPGVFASGILAGIMLASKHTLLVPVFIFLAAAVKMSRHRDRPRYLALILPAVLLVPAAWWAKAWLFFGDPFYPLGAVFLPGFFADPGLAGAERPLYTIFIQGGRSLVTLPFDAWNLVSKNSFLLIAALPFFRLGAPAGTKRVLAVSALTLLGLAMAVRGSMGDLERYCLPVFALWNAVALALLARHLAPGTVRRAVGGALFLLGAVFNLEIMATQGDFFREAPVTRWLSGRDGTEGFRERALESYGAILPEIRKACAGGMGRLLAVGETFAWGIPVRVMGEGFEAPLAWKSAKESPTPERVAVRWRQAGIRWILYNHMIASWNRFQVPAFVWSPGSLRRYADFARPRLALLARSGRYDPGVGSGTLYSVRSRPLPRPPSRILFLPGIESALSFASLAWLNSHFATAQVRFDSMRSALPEVAWLDVLEAQSLLDGGKFREARGMVREAERAGFEDDLSIFIHAVSAGRLGLAAESGAFLERARQACPLMEDRIRECQRDSGLRAVSPSFKRVK